MRAACVVDVGLSWYFRWAETRHSCIAATKVVDNTVECLPTLTISSYFYTFCVIINYQFDSVLVQLALTATMASTNAYVCADAQPAG